MSNSSSVNAFSFDPTIQMVQNTCRGIVNGCSALYGRTFTVVHSTNSALLKIGKSPDVFRQLMHGTLSTIEIAQAFYHIKAPEKLIKDSKIVQRFFSFIRIFDSLEYVSSGRARTDFRKSDVLGLVMEAGFAVGRIGVAATWLAEQKLLDLGRCAVALGPIATRVALGSVIDVAFLIGIAAATVDAVRLLMTGVNILYNCFNLLNLVSEELLIMFGMIGGFHPLTFAMLGVIATVSGITTTLLEPSTR